MQVTNIAIFPIDNSTTALKGFAQVTLDGVLRLTGIKIFEGDKGPYISYPKNSKSKQNLCFMFPTDKDLREHISKEIIDEYFYMIEQK
jgi:DNA-binding cell septation regulator SpoVG